MDSRVQPSPSACSRQEGPSRHHATKGVRALHCTRPLHFDSLDMTIAAPGSEDSVKIGYDYGHLVTGEEQQVELGLLEEAVQAAGDREVPDPLDEKTMVVTSAEALAKLDLEPGYEAINHAC